MKKIILICSVVVLASFDVFSQSEPTAENSPSAAGAASGAVTMENDGFVKAGTNPLKITMPSSTYHFFNLPMFNIQNVGEYMGIGTNTNGQLEFLANGPGSFGTSNTKMIIDDDNGNVGIGVINPLAKLDVVGGNWDVANGNGDFKVGDATYQFKLGVATGGGGAGDVRMFAKGGTARMIWGSGTTDRMALTSGGYLGIGTIDPSVGLDIKGTTNDATAINVVSAAGNLSSINFYRSTGTLTAPAATSSAYNLGRVVFWGHNGTSFFEGASIRSLTEEAWSSTGRGAYLSFYTTTAGTTSLTEKLRIDHNGNVGIGTTTPDNKLDVKGIMRAEEVIVETGWADYVFEEDYQLNDLEKVENYIKENKHLPNVPSAKEVQEKGAHVADLMTKMMAKIEELTLYTIQQQKEIDELKRKLENR